MTSRSVTSNLYTRKTTWESVVKFVVKFVVNFVVKSIVKFVVKFVVKSVVKFVRRFAVKFLVKFEKWPAGQWLKNCTREKRREKGSENWCANLQNSGLNWCGRWCENLRENGIKNSAKKVAKVGAILFLSSLHVTLSNRFLIAMF